MIKRLIVRIALMMHAHRLRLELINLVSLSKRGKAWTHLAGLSNRELIRQARLVFLDDSNPERKHLEPCISIQQVGDAITGRYDSLERSVVFTRAPSGAWTFSVTGNIHSLDHLRNIVDTFTHAFDKAQSLANTDGVKSDNHNPENK